MMKKIKIYRMPLSRVFPATHPRKGEDTNFRTKIQDEIKKHTCRANYPLWKKRIDEVNEGKAVLVIYEWTDKPYNSMTNNLFVFHAEWIDTSFIKELENDQRYKNAVFMEDSGIGVQKLDIKDAFYVDGTMISESLIAANDGLTHVDFRAWFRNYKLIEPMAIIQFAKFRY